MTSAQRIITPNTAREDHRSDCTKTSHLKREVLLRARRVARWYDACKVHLDVGEVACRAEDRDDGVLSKVDGWD